MKTWDLKFVKNQNERLELLSSGVFAIKRKNYIEIGQICPKWDWIRFPNEQRYIQVKKIEIMTQFSIKSQRF